MAMASMHICSSNIIMRPTSCMHDQTTETRRTEFCWTKFDTNSPPPAPKGCINFNMSTILLHHQRPHFVVDFLVSGANIVWFWNQGYYRIVVVPALVCHRGPEEAILPKATDSMHCLDQYIWLVNCHNDARVRVTIILHNAVLTCQIRWEDYWLKGGRLRNLLLLGNETKMPGVEAFAVELFFGTAKTANVSIGNFLFRGAHDLMQGHCSSHCGQCWKGICRNTWDVEQFDCRPVQFLVECYGVWHINSMSNNAVSTSLQSSAYSIRSSFPVWGFKEVPSN